MNLISARLNRETRLALSPVCMDGLDLDLNLSGCLLDSGVNKRPSADLWIFDWKQGIPSCKPQGSSSPLPWLLTLGSLSALRPPVSFQEGLPFYSS